MHDLLQVEQHWDGGHRLLLPLILLACQVARASEVGALRVQDVTVDAEALTLMIRRAKGGRSAMRSVRLPTALSERSPEFGAYLQTRSPESRLMEPLAFRSASTDAIFQRIAYRLRQMGISWSPHRTRSMVATERDVAGADRAEVSESLGHALVQTASGSYVTIDPLRIAPRARAHVNRYSVVLTTSAVQYVLGLSQRQAETVHAVIGGRLTDILVSLHRRRTGSGRSQAAPSRSSYR